jgi:hypothetical protein
MSWAFDTIRAAFFKVPLSAPIFSTSTASTGVVVDPELWHAVLRLGTTDCNSTFIYPVPTQSSQLYPIPEYATDDDSRQQDELGVTVEL